MAARVVRAESLGLGGGCVRLQLSSDDALMSVDLEREQMLSLVAHILYLAGVRSVTVTPDGDYTARLG